MDLDLNYIGSEERRKMLDDRPRIEKAVHQISRARGYKLQQSRDEHAGRKFFLPYLSATENPDRVEPDLNYLNRVPVLAAKKRTLWQPGDIDKPEARVVSLEEICAGKLCALLSRSMPRDLYDVMRFPIVAGSALGTPRFRALFVAFAGTLDHALHSYGPDRLERVTEDNIRTQLHPMLSRADRPNAAFLRERAWEIVGPLIELTDAERKYIDRIQVGELAPELLFPNHPEIAERLRRHPALLWKSENAKKFVAGRRRRAKT